MRIAIVFILLGLAAFSMVDHGNLRINVVTIMLGLGGLLAALPLFRSPKK